MPPVALNKPDLVIHAVSDGKRIGLRLHNIPGKSSDLKRARAWWCAPSRMWVFAEHDPMRCLAALRAIYRREYVSLDEAPGLLTAACARPETDYFGEQIEAQVFPLERAKDLTQGDFAVSFAYDGLCVSAMRRLGAVYHGPAAAWQVQGPAARILDALRETAGITRDCVYVHERPVVLEELATGASDEGITIQVPAAAPPRASATDAPAQAADGQSFMSAELPEIERLPIDERALAQASERAGLRDYQVAGVRHLLGQTGACLGDDMGLGKSRQAVVAARLAAGDGRVLIACPASLRINWEREIHMIYPDAAVGIVGADRMATLHGCQWVISGYTALAGLVREEGLSFAVMAMDEAHYLKEHKSGRTQNALLLAQRIPRRYVITGTPLLNREIELHTLLRLTGHPIGLLALKAFTKEYSGTKEKRKALAAALKGWMLRRLKGDALRNLAGKSRQVRWISPKEGLGAYRAIYNDMTLQAMPKITRLRQHLEALKTDFMIETATSLGAGDKIIIFCEYMATVAVLRDAFRSQGVGCVTMVGADPDRKRQQAIDAFQNDPAVTVFVGSTACASVGITLTAANYVTFASLPWTPAVMEQGEDRAYRLGQKRPVIVIVPLVADTLDAQVWALLQAKGEKVGDVTEAQVTRLVKDEIGRTTRGRREPAFA